MRFFRSSTPSLMPTSLNPADEPLAQKLLGLWALCERGEIDEAELARRKKTLMQVRITFSLLPMLSATVRKLLHTHLRPFPTRPQTHLAIHDAANDALVRDHIAAAGAQNRRASYVDRADDAHRAAAVAAAAAAILRRPGGQLPHKAAAAPASERSDHDDASASASSASLPLPPGAPPSNRTRAEDPAAQPQPPSMSVSPSPIAPPPGAEGRPKKHHRMHRALNRTLGKHRALRRKGTPAASAGPSSAVVAAPHQSSSGDDDAATAARTESMNRARRKTSNGSLDRAPRRVVATVGVERAPSVAAARAEEWALQQKALSAEHLSRAAQTAGQDGADTVAADAQHAQLDAETERRLDEAEQTARRTWLRVPLERLPPRLRDEYQAKTSPWARRRASIHILSSAMGLRHRLSNAGLPLELHARFLQESGLSSQRELEQVEVGDMVEILNDMDLEVRLGLHGRADLFEIARALTVTASSEGEGEERDEGGSNELEECASPTEVDVAPTKHLRSDNVHTTPPRQGTTRDAVLTSPGDFEGECTV